MIDPFVLSHPAIVLTSDRIAIQDATIHTYIYRICCEKNPPQIPLEIFRRIKSAHVQSLHVELQLEQYLRGMLPSELSVMEQRLVEAVLLHRFTQLINAQGVFTPESGRAVAVMGTMIQHRLTQLSLAVESTEHDRVFDLKNMPAINEKQWEVECLGATAVVRVIEAFNEVEGVVIRLPTIHEDVDQGIDVLVEILPSTNHFPVTPYHLAVSVKSINQRKRLQIEHILPHSSAAQFKVFQGARLMSEKFEREFLPIHILVGRSKHNRLDVSTDENDVHEIERVLDRIENARARAQTEQRAVA